MPKIIVIGSSNTDMVIQTSRIPRPGETILGGSFFMNPGGKGANQAVACARLGGQTHFVAKVGNDVFGQMAKAQFEQEGIDSTFVFIDPIHASGIALINVDSEGENSITVASGANAALNQEDIAAAQGLFSFGDYVLIQLEISLATVDYSIRKAAEKGLKVILNPAPAAEIPLDLYPHLFAITPNETEAELLTGIPVMDLATAQQAADILLQRGVQHVIVTLGSKGAYYQSAMESFLVETEKVQAIDSTAAGDCFNGALAVALSNQKSWLASIQFACRAATLSVTKPGAQASMPYLKDI
ncbi:ribokinase [Aquirufa sp. ROCK2-A2]